MKIPCVLLFKIQLFGHSDKKVTDLEELRAALLETGTRHIMNVVPLVDMFYTLDFWNIASWYIGLAGEADKCNITTPITAQLWFSTLCSLSECEARIFLWNASFTAHCSGSTKSIHILNRKQKMKLVKDQARQNPDLATVACLELIHLSCPSFQGSCQWFQL